jgi:hypothetical protein
MESGCNYDQGVLLYNVLGKNSFMKKDFPNKQHKYATKIVYELCKSVGLDYRLVTKENLFPSLELKEKKQEGDQNLLPENKLVAVQSCSQSVSSGVEEKEATELPAIIPDSGTTEYPVTLRRIISEYAETFQERSKLHRILTEMPEGNSQALKTRRAEVFDLIKSLSARLEFLYSIRQQFDANGEIPSDDEIWPEPKAVAKPELPSDPELLRKMKKNQQSANTKDQNMLDYQNEKKAEELCPMPAGPKRIKLEKRIKARLKLIQEIDLKLTETDVV